MSKSKVISGLIFTVLLMLNHQAFSFKKSASGKDAYPSTFTLTGSSATYCPNVTPSAITATLTNVTCGNGGGPTPSYVSAVVTWYKNSTNSTSGGTLVQTTTPPDVSTTTYTYTPSSLSGTFYYYAKITWSAGSNCAVAGSITTSSTFAVTVTSPTLSSVSQAAAICSGASTATINLTGLMPSTAQQITYNVGAGNLTANITSSSSGTGSFTLSSPTNGQTLTVTKILVNAGCVTSSFTSGNSTTITVSGLPSITSPTGTSSQTVCKSSTPTDLSVTATAGSGTISSYQWYSNATNTNSGGTLVATHNTVATTDTYTPVTSTAGTFYYYCIVTNSNGCTFTSPTSIMWSVVVQNGGPNVTTQPSTVTQNLCINGTSTALSIVASGSGTTYQWYSSPNSNGSSSTLISGATSPSYTPLTTSVGTLYYYCVATNGCSTASNVSGAVIVSANNTSTLSSAAGTNAQTVCINTSITNITYATTGATGATFSGLPAGVIGSWSSNVATISGTPTASGTFNYTVNLTGGCGSVSSIGSISVTANNTITLTSAAGTDAQTVCINSPITNITYSTTGATGATFSGLPTGVTGSWVSNVVTISGTPTASGPFSYTVNLTGGCGSISTGGSITVNTINTVTLTSGAGTTAQTLCINTPITNITYSTTGATGASFSGLPAGVTGNWASNIITISGIPTASGPFSYTVNLTGGCGSVSTGGTISVTPNNTVSLTSAAGTDAQTLCINTPITNITYSTTGATGASFSGLPAGVTGNWASNIITISGNPTASGPFSYTVNLTGGCGSVSTGGTISVTPNNTVSLTSAVGTDAQTLCINTTITNITYSTTGATGATFGSLPTGVTGNWNSNVVTISGTPTVSGPFSYTVNLTGGCGTISTGGSISVTPNNTVSLTSAVGTDAQTLCINTTITNITYSTTGATGATFGSLPTGVTGNWNSNVVTISGTPTVSGPFSYTVNLTGGCGTISTGGSISVTPNNTVSLTSAVGTDAQTLCINTPITNITYSTTGATGATFGGLPSGVSGNWNSNVATISGTPSVTGSFSYTIDLTGGCGLISTGGSIGVSSDNTSTLTSGTGSDDQFICLNSAITPITYSTTGATGATFSGLPAGVTGNWASNVATINGTATAAGSYSYNITLTGGCGSISSFGAITVSASGESIWSGNTSTDWSDATNWSCGVPTISTNATIPFGRVRYPIIGSAITASAKILYIDFGSSLAMNSTSILQLSGDFTSFGSFTAGGGTVKFTGSSLQNIGGSGNTVMTFANITITNTTSPVSVSVETSQNLSGVLTLSSNSTFDADGSADTTVFKLLSTSDVPTVDASIAALPSGASVTGNVTVQRYMGRSGVAKYSYNVFRDISAPVHSTLDNLSTVSDLQKYLPVSGQFTGSSTITTDGSTPDPLVDYTKPSLTFYDEAIGGAFNNGYMSFPSVGGNTANSHFVKGRGYSLFIFGSDYPVLQNNNAKWALTGQINSGPISLPVAFTKTGTGGTYNSSTDGWNLVGNPYPSAIDWSAASGWTKTNINNAIYIDDYSSGSDVYASYVNGVSTNNGSRYIAMGQAFWVRANALLPVLSIDEGVKVTKSNILFFRESSPPNRIKITLSADPDNRDETVIYFDGTATENFDGQLDAYKLTNKYPSFNLSSISSGSERYAINALPLGDCPKTVALDVSDVASGAYQLNFSEFESMPSSASIELRDNFKGTIVDVRKNPLYPFEVDLSNLSSFGADRFSLRVNLNGSIASKASCNTGLSNITAYPIPVKGIINIEAEGDETAQGEVFNSLGISLGVVTFTNEGIKQSAHYDFAKEAGGIYYIRVRQGGKIEIIRIVKD